MIRIYFVVEGDSDGRSCEIIARKARPEIQTDYLPAGGCGEIKRRGDRLIGGLLKKRADCVIVVVDKDSGHPGRGPAFEQEIQAHCDAFPQAYLVLAIEELEAWLLADLRAVEDYLSQRSKRMSLKSQQKGDTQTFEDPKGELTRLFRLVCGPRYGYEESMAPEIAEYLALERALPRNESLGTFCTTVKERCPKE